MVTVKPVGITMESPQAGLAPHDQVPGVFQSPFPKATHTADLKLNVPAKMAHISKRSLRLLGFKFKAFVKTEREFSKFQEYPKIKTPKIITISY